MVNAREIAEDLGIPVTFKSELITKRLKKKPRQFSHEAEDEPVKDAKQKTKELKVKSRRISERSTPKDVLAFHLKSDLKESVPNLLVALHILLTLPVSVASGERSFTKLKLIQTYLLSSIAYLKTDW